MAEAQKTIDKLKAKAERIAVTPIDRSILSGSTSDFPERSIAY